MRNCPEKIQICFVKVALLYIESFFTSPKPITVAEDCKRLKIFRSIITSSVVTLKAIFKKNNANLKSLTKFQNLSKFYLGLAFEIKADLETSTMNIDRFLTKIQYWYLTQYTNHKWNISKNIDIYCINKISICIVFNQNLLQLKSDTGCLCEEFTLYYNKLCNENVYSSRKHPIQYIAHCRFRGQWHP